MAADQLNRDRLRVATYNVHDCIGRDGRHAPDRIASIVACLDADVVALQEVTLDHAGDVVALLEETTGMQAIDGTLFERGVGRYGNVLLARCPVVGQKLHDLSYTQREPRGLVDAEFVIHGNVWRIIATHLGLSWRERRMQLRYVANLLSSTELPTVIMGDFNIWLGARTLAPLARLGFTQCHPASFPTRLAPLLSLDRVFVRSPLRLVACSRVVTDMTRIASDHFPVVATVQCP